MSLRLCAVLLAAVVAAGACGKYGPPRRTPAPTHGAEAPAALPGDGSQTPALPGTPGKDAPEQEPR